MNSLSDTTPYQAANIDIWIKTHAAIRATLGNACAEAWADAERAGVHFVECKALAMRKLSIDYEIYFELFSVKEGSENADNQRNAIVAYCRCFWRVDVSVWRVPNTHNLVVAKGEKKAFGQGGILGYGKQK